MTSLTKVEHKQSIHEKMTNLESTEPKKDKKKSTKNDTENFKKIQKTYKFT